MCRSFCMGFPMSFPHLLSMLVYSSVEWRPSPTTHVVFMSVKGRVGGTDLALIRGTTPKMKPISRMVNCDRLARWWAFNSNRVKNGTKTARHVWGLSLCQNLGISSCCIVLCCKKKRLSFSHGILGTWIKMDKGLISWPLMGRLMWFFSSLPVSSNGVLRGKTPLFYWGNHLFLWDIETLTLTCYITIYCIISYWQIVMHLKMQDPQVLVEEEHVKLILDYKRISPNTRFVIQLVVAIH